jgi:hypothetical protein
MKWLQAGVAAILVAMTVLASGCATNLYPGGPTPAGIGYTNVRAPAQYLAVPVDNTAGTKKVGKASVTAFLGIVSLGDSSIQAAMKDGEITKIHHVDYEIEHFLYAIFAKQTTIVYGE